MQLMNSIRQFLGFSQPEAPCVPSAAVDRMLADLHRLCATLPGGEVEVFLSSRCVNLQLSWAPEAEESGAAAYRPETGIVFRLDGRSDRATYREVVEPAALTEEEAEEKKAAAAAEEEVKEEKAEEAEVKDNTEVSSEAIDSQAEKEVKQVTGESSQEMKDTVEPVKEMQVTVKEPADSPKATAKPMKVTAESAPEDTDFGKAFVEEKPSKAALNLRCLKDFLQQHYAFRYNRLTDCTECAVLPEGIGLLSSQETQTVQTISQTTDSSTLEYHPIDTRLLNTLSLSALDHGVDCWDRDVKRLVESTQMPSYHPFTDYMANLPTWDGRDRLTALAQRVSDDAQWVRHFRRWMLAVAAQWLKGDGFGRSMNGDTFGQRMGCTDFGQRANSVAPLLVSARQGLGKSTFCRQLLPTKLQAYFTESFDLNNPTAAEHKLTAFGLINIDEFDRLSAERMPLLKNLMQLERITLRRAFKHSAEPLPRIASFIATSNRYDLLTDLTGSRRFICVDVQHPIDCSTPIEYDQLYAQLKEAILAGERTWFDKEEEVEIQARNQAFYRVLPAQELLEETVEFCEAGAEGAALLSSATLYSLLQQKHPAALRDYSPRAFSRLLMQWGRRVHTKNGNGYWVRMK